MAALLLPPGALVVLTLWLQSPAWTQYLIFAHLQPANLLLDQAAPGVPHSSLFMTVAVLAAWTGLMFSASAAAFRWKDELS